MLKMQVQVLHPMPKCYTLLQSIHLSRVTPVTINRYIHVSKQSAQSYYCNYMKYVYLLIAIISEVIATSSLKASNEFTKLWPSVIVVVGYASAFYFMSLTLKTIPVGITYAIWSGVGIVLVSITGFFIYKQRLDLPALLGIGLIIAGVLVINLFSKSTVA